VIVEVPPSAAFVTFDEIKIDSSGQNAIFTFEISKDFIGNPSSIRWELEGLASDAVKAAWPSQVENFGGTELSRIITVEIPGVHLTTDEVFTVKITPLDPLTFLNNEEQGQDTKRVFLENSVT
ncbi:hypothetical protein MJH12_17125, partial [bacterium]|nr:hypothetical protein [bacterium]